MRAADKRPAPSNAMNQNLNSAQWLALSYLLLCSWTGGGGVSRVLLYFEKMGKGENSHEMVLLRKALCSLL